MLLLFFLLIYFYQNYIYYKIPYNPLVELITDTPTSCYLKEYHPNNKMIDKSSHNLKSNTLISKYFKDLNLIPLKKEANRNEIFNHKNDTHFSYMLKIGPSPNYNVFISEIWLDNLSILSIRSDKLGFNNNGYYKIIDTKFDYKYVYDLITNSQN